jgi:hypothetical protein
MIYTCNTWSLRQTEHAVRFNNMYIPMECHFSNLASRIFEGIDTEAEKPIASKTSGSHGSKHEDGYLVGCCAL